MDDLKIKIRVVDVMHHIGVPAGLKGYTYSVEAVMLAIKNPAILETLTKGLYVEIAQKYASTPSRVERAIRHALEVAFQYGDIEVLFDYFGYTVRSDKGRPTVGTFVATIAEWISLGRDGGPPIQALSA